MLDHRGTNKNAVEIKNKSALGFHRMKYFNKIVPINECFLQQYPSNEIRNAVDKFCKENDFSYYNFHDHTGDLRNLIIRTTTLNQLMVIVQFGDAEEKNRTPHELLKSSFPQINSLQYIVNRKLNETYFDLEVKKFHGEDFIFEEIDNLKWKIKAKSFFKQILNRLASCTKVLWKCLKRRKMMLFMTFILALGR